MSCCRSEIFRASGFELSEEQLLHLVVLLPKAANTSANCVCDSGGKVFLQLRDTSAVPSDLGNLHINRDVAPCLCEPQARQPLRTKPIERPINAQDDGIFVDCRTVRGSEIALECLIERNR